jgi:hypothetical protein
LIREKPAGKEGEGEEEEDGDQEMCGLLSEASATVSFALPLPVFFAAFFQGLQRRKYW